MRQTWQTMTAEEKTKRIKELIAEGASAAMIAAEIGGTTRNAVIGFCHRREIVLGGGQPNAPKRKPKAPSNIIPIRKPVARTVKPKPTKAAEVVALDLPNNQHPVGPADILNIQFGRCRGPLNASYKGLNPEEMFFCGQVTEPDSSWCKTCQAKYTIGRAKARRIMETGGAEVAPAPRKRRPFLRWQR